MSRRRGPGGSERAFQTAVLELAQVTGWRSYHPHDSRRSAAGYPDLTLVRAGACILAELKTDTGRVTDALAAFAAVSGIEAVVWRPRDWPVIEARLTRPWPLRGAATRSRFPRSRALHVLAPVEDDRGPDARDIDPASAADRARPPAPCWRAQVGLPCVCGCRTQEWCA